jgi:hypothetical protein
MRSRVERLIWVLVLAVLWVGDAAACIWDHPDRETLIGNWRWVFTFDISGPDLTPESIGVEQRLFLRDDNIYEFIVDGAVVNSGGWCIRECTDPSPSSPCAESLVVLYLSEFGGFLPGEDSQPEYFFSRCGSTGCQGFPGPLVPNGVMLTTNSLSPLWFKFEQARVTPVVPRSWAALKARY